MTAFGGQSQYGTASCGGDAYGLLPSYVTYRMLAALQGMAAANGGYLATLREYAGELSSRQQIEQELLGGMPAMLVLYTGGRVAPKTTNGHKYRETQQYAVICCADRWTMQVERIHRRSVYHAGVESMLAHARVLCGGRKLAIENASPLRPSRIQQIGWWPGMVVFGQHFELETTVDLAPGIATLPDLKELGLVCNPTDIRQLFAPDNVTPNATPPREGVFEV